MSKLSTTYGDQPLSCSSWRARICVALLRLFHRSFAVFTSIGRSWLRASPIPRLNPGATRHTTTAKLRPRRKPTTRAGLLVALFNFIHSPFAVLASFRWRWIRTCSSSSLYPRSASFITISKTSPFGEAPVYRTRLNVARLRFFAGTYAGFTSELRRGIRASSLSCFYAVRATCFSAVAIFTPICKSSIYRAFFDLTLLLFLWFSKA